MDQIAKDQAFNYVKITVYSLPTYAYKEKVQNRCDHLNLRENLKLYQGEWILN